MQQDRKHRKVHLGDIATVSTGYPFRRRVAPEQGGDVAVVQLRGPGDSESSPVVAPIMLCNDGGKYTRYLLREGDLLFQSRGSRHPVRVVESGVQGIAATGLHVIRPNQTRVLPDFLAWWLNHPTSQAKLRADLARGTYIPFVSKTDLQTFLVPEPSRELQHRIVEINGLRRQEHDLRHRLAELTQQLVDAATLAAATGQH